MTVTPSPSRMILSHDDAHSSLDVSAPAVVKRKFVFLPFVSFAKPPLVY
jgi:hypothetical protein